VTILEVIQRTAGFLAKRGVDSPRLQVELLLAHVLRLPRMQLYLNFERNLTEAEAGRLRPLVKRRAEREPLQHIIGSTSFCGLEITVNRHVLVPRPETELLAELAAKFLSTVSRQPSTVLDFGTGSGCLAVTLAQKFPGAEVHGLDISPEALAVAQANAAQHQTPVRFHLGDGFAALPAKMNFDLILSNPPYIAAAEIETLEPEVRDFDPRLALDGGLDGLSFYRRLAAEAGAWLKPAGKLMTEFGDDQAGRVQSIFGQCSWKIEAVEKDLSGRERVLVARRF